MNTAIYRRPGPALGLAVGAGLAAHAANVNAAMALNATPTEIAIAVGLLIVLLGFLASRR
jgi:hypothetical protein